MTDDDQTPEERIRALGARSLADYRVGAVSLKRLIDDLDVVWSLLAPSEWRDNIRGYWWTLEQVYAVAHDRDEIDTLPDDALAEIDEAVTVLQRLLSS